MEKLDDKTLDFLEEQIPELAAAAVTIAYNNAIAAGHYLVLVEGDNLIEQFPDGTKRFIKKVKRATRNPSS